MKKLLLFLLLTSLAFGAGTENIPVNTSNGHVKATALGGVGSPTTPYDFQDVVVTNIGAGAGTVTSFSFTDSTGIDGTVTNATTTPTLSLVIDETGVTGLVTDLANKQPLDADLTAIAALGTTSFGRSFLDRADAAAGRTLLGLGTLATQNGTFSGTSSGTNTGDQTITLTSDVTGSGTGSFATTLATVNSNVGSFTNASVTVNAKGLVTAASSGTSGGDFSSNTSTSVDSEILLFSGTAGKTGKRATGSGLVTATSGVYGTTTNNTSNWDTAFTDRLKWDGGATGLTAATGRTSLGATTVGSNLFTLTNPIAVTFLRVNADNSVDTLSASSFRTAIGAGTGNGDALTTNPLSQFASTTSSQLAGVITDETGSGALVFANTPTLVSPILGTPTSGALTNCTFPTLNQNTTGSAASLSISGQVGLLTFTGLGSTNRIKTIRDAADTLLELGGSYTPTGTWTSLTMVTPVLGTPTSGTLTNCTGLPVAGITSSTSTALGVGSLEVGATSDTTIARSSAGHISVEGSVAGLASDTLSFFTASTSNAIGVGTIELGHATDTTIARSGAGAITVEGVQVILSGAALGTPSSGTLTNCTFPTLNQNTTGSAASLSIASQTGLLTFTGLASTNRIKTVRDAADTVLELGGSYTPTGTWTSLTMVTPVLGTPTSGTLTNCTGLPVAGITSSTSTALGVGSLEVGNASDTTIARVGAGQISVEGVNVVTTSSTDTLTNKTISNSNNTVGDGVTVTHDLTTVPNQTGGWNEYFVTGSDFTTTNTTATTITGLTSGTLTAGAVYEFEVVLRCLNAADTTGMKIALSGGGSGTAATVFATGNSNSSSATAGANVCVNQIDTLTQALVTYSAGEGVFFLKGFFKARGSGTPTFIVQAAKVTSNTATVRVGSVMRIKLAHT